MGGDPDKLIRIAEIDELLSLGNKNLSRGMEQQLINEKIALENLWLTLIIWMTTTVDTST